MGKELTKVVYKKESKSTEEFSMIVNPSEVCFTMPFVFVNCRRLIMNEFGRTIIQYARWKDGGLLLMVLILSS